MPRSRGTTMKADKGPCYLGFQGGLSCVCMHGRAYAHMTNLLQELGLGSRFRVVGSLGTLLPSTITRGQKDASRLL